MSNIKRLYVIRHVRYYYHSVRLAFWFQTKGKYIGSCINQGDIDFLKDVWIGKS